MLGNFSIQRFFVPSICILLGVFSVVSEYYVREQRNEPVSWIQAFSSQFPFWVSWGIFSILMQRFVRRFHFGSSRALRSLAAHLIASILAAILNAGLYLLFSRLADIIWVNLTKNAPLSHGTGIMIIPFITFNVILYWLLLAIVLSFFYQQQYQQEVLKASRLGAQLSESRLQALKMQLHPHFLFNTLHSITALVIGNENRDAVKMINRLSEFLRLTLESADEQLVTLKNELEFTERYLEIESIRFQDRLTIQMDIDPQTLDAEVPNLLLQPLVENAVRHGIAPHSTANRIRIESRLQDGRLHLAVWDNGRGMIDNGVKNGKSGLGLKNTQARLSELYGEDYSFSLDSGEGGTTAKIVLPFVKTGSSTSKE